MRRKRCNIAKQEAVVSELWDFARDAQKLIKVGCVIKSRDVELEDVAIRKTLNRIMEIFGYGVLEVQ